MALLRRTRRDSDRCWPTADPERWGDVTRCERCGRPFMAALAPTAKDPRALVWLPAGEPQNERAHVA